MSRAYDAFLATRGPCVLFESTSAPSPRARRSLLARNPRAVLVADEDGLRARRPRTESGASAGTRSPRVRSMLREVRPGRWPDEGGIAGALAYDAARPGPGVRARRSSSPWPSIASSWRRRAPRPATAATAARARGSTRSSRRRARSAGPAPAIPLDLARWSSLTRDEHRAAGPRRPGAHRAPATSTRPTSRSASTCPGPRAGCPSTRRCGGSAPRRSPATCGPAASRSCPRRRSGC